MPAEQERKWLACPECEAPCRDRPLPVGAELRCGRCGMRVKRTRGSRSLQAVWAIATTGLILVPLANLEPILTFDVSGNTQSNLIITGVVGLFQQGYWPVAALVFFSAIAAPALHLAAVWYVAAGCSLGWRLPGLARAAKIAEELESWNLVAVFLVATVVAVVKLDMLGTVAWQQGALWVFALALCSLVTVQLFDRELVQSRLEELA